jgi:hypothetical protein
MRLRSAAIAAIAACLAVLASAVAAGAAADDALTGEMLRALGARYPKYQFKSEADDRIGIYEAGKWIGVLDLANLRDICRTQGAAKCEEQKNNRVAMALGTPASESFSRNAVRAVVRPAAYIATLRRQFSGLMQGKPADEVAKIEQSIPFTRPLSKHFVRVWVQDSPNGMAPISIHQVEKEKLDPAELDRLSLENMKGEQVPLLAPTKLHPSIWISEGNDYVSSVLVDQGLWARVAGDRAKDNATVCFPLRQLMIAYFPKLDPENEVDVSKLCNHFAEKYAPAFVAEPVRRIGDNWEFQ